MKRTTARETVFKMLFQSEFYPQDEVAPVYDRYVADYPDGAAEEENPVDEAAPEELAAVRERAEAVLARRAEIDAILSEAMEGWKLGRLGTVERNILRLAVYEIKFDDEVPVRVAANEAVELARKFGGEESPGFVNGVLGRVIRKDETIDAG